MGDLNALKSEIKNQALNEAAEVRQAAEEKAARIQAEGKAAADAHFEEILSVGKREAAALKQQIQTAHSLEARRRILTAKEDLVQETFTQALQNMLRLPLDRRAGLFVRLMLASAQDGTEEVRPAVDDRALVESLLSQVNLELQKQGKSGKLHLGSNEPGIKGGFLLAGDHYRVDNSFESLLMNMKDDLVPEVARILFQ